MSVANRIDPSRSWREIAEALLADAPDPSALAAVYDDEMTRAVAYIEERSLLTLPEEPGRLVLAGDRWDSARHRIPVVVAHEVWPGRHAHAVRAEPAPVRGAPPAHVQLTMNGWALYAQELMADEGYYMDLETHAPAPGGHAARGSAGGPRHRPPYPRHDPGGRRWMNW